MRLVKILAAAAVMLVAVDAPGDRVTASAPPVEAANNFSVIDVSVGRSTGCAVRSDGALACWGDNYGGPAAQPTGAFTQVASGGSHACALRTDQTAVCWGTNAVGESSAPGGAFTDVAVGSAHSCGVRTTGELVCWGDNNRGQSAAPGGTFTQVSAGGATTCAVRTNGSVACWGFNSAGQASPPSGAFLTAVAGQFASCGIRTNLTIACWGSSTAGVTSPPAGAFVQISVGDGSACAVQTGGGTTCWGGGQSSPTGAYTKVATGSGYGCGIDLDGALACWGRDGTASAPWGLFAQIGNACGLRSDGSIACWDRTSGTLTPPAGTFTRVSTGYPMCAIRTDQTLACWGPAPSPKLSPPPGQFTQVSVGGTHACAIRPSQTVECWGESFSGEATPLSGTFTQISAGRGSTCGIRTDQSLACWGSNSSGLTNPPIGTFTSVSLGDSHACAIRTDTTVACWGTNTAGEVTPPTGGFKQVSAGMFFTCGIRSDNTISCWGSNSNGQVGPPTGTYTQVTASTIGACALNSASTLQCWGNLSILGWTDGWPTPRSRVPAGSVRPVSPGVPAGASATLVNLTMVDGVGSGYITADKCSAIVPGPQTKSNGNHGTADAIGNLSVVPLDTDGRFCLYNQTGVNMVSDAQGYFAPTGTAGQVLIAMSPTRKLDTRVAPLTTPPAGSITKVTTDVPAGTTSVLANLAMVDGTGSGYITADKCSALTAGPQTKSNGNHVAGTAIGNLSVVPVDPDGSFCIYNQVAVNLVVDLQGYFVPARPDGLSFTASTPTRKLDTRAGNGAKPAPGVITRVSTGVAAGTTAVLVNLAMVDGDVPGYITADKCSSLTAGPQNRSNGNHAADAAIANLAVVPVDPDGSFCIYNQVAVNLVVDLQGSFSTTGTDRFFPIAPRRVLDTRE